MTADGLAPPSGRGRKRPRARLFERLRGYLLAGLLLTAPLWLTIYLAWWVVALIDRQVDRLLPPHLHPDNFLPFTVPGVGVLTVLILVTGIGALTAGFIGRWVIGAGERIVDRLPVLRNLYGGAKQVLDTVLARRRNAFRQVVILELPRLGVWAPAFLIGEAPDIVVKAVARPLVSLYVPTTPNPTAGFLAFAPPEDITPADLTVEEGLQLVVSGGIVSPPHGRPATGFREPPAGSAPSLPKAPVPAPVTELPEA